MAANRYRLGIIGDQCGKSSLIRRFVDELFIVVHAPTKGEEIQEKAGVSIDNEVCDLSILDTAGQNLWQNMYDYPGYLQPWLENIDGVIVVYSVTSVYSFDVAPVAIEEIGKLKKLPIILVATQVDKEPRVVTEQDGTNLGRRNRIPYYESSASTGEGVKDAFEAIVREIRKSRKPPPLPPPPNYPAPSANNALPSQLPPHPHHRFSTYQPQLPPNPNPRYSTYPLPPSIQTPLRAPVSLPPAPITTPLPAPITTPLPAPITTPLPPPITTPVRPPALQTPPISSTPAPATTPAPPAVTVTTAPPAAPTQAGSPSLGSTSSKKAAASPALLKKEQSKNALPTKSGPLQKLGGGLRRVMQRRFFAIKDGQLMFYRSKAAFDEENSHKTISLLTTTVKPSKVNAKCFDLVTLTKTFTLQAETTEEMNDWIRAIQDTLVALLNSGAASAAPQPTPDKHSNTLPHSSSNSNITQPAASSSNGPNDADVREQIWQDLMHKYRGNSTCADCGGQNPDWCSINLGILLCIQCSGVHRSLGTHITKVRSVVLDKIDEDVLDYIKAVGNVKANKNWEAKVPLDRKKPTPKDDRMVKEQWIKDKYVAREFLNNAAVVDYSKPELDEKLYEQILLNRFETALKLVVLGASVNAKGEHGHSVLHAAAGLGRPLLVILLLLNGADMNVMDSLGRTPLDYANSYLFEHPGTKTQLTSADTTLKKRGATDTGTFVNLEALTQQANSAVPDVNSPGLALSSGSSFLQGGAGKQPNALTLSIGGSRNGPPSPRASVMVPPALPPAGKEEVAPNSRDGVGQMSSLVTIASKALVITLQEPMIPPASSSKQFLAFITEIEDQLGTRTLLKKIKQFDVLHRQLQETFPKLVPKYPRTKLTQYQDERAVAALQAQLQEYVNEVCTKPQLLMLPAFKKFVTSDLARHLTVRKKPPPVPEYIQDFSSMDRMDMMEETLNLL